MTTLSSLMMESDAYSVPESRFSVRPRHVEITSQIGKTLPSNLQAADLQTPFGMARAFFSQTALYRLDFEPRGQRPRRLDPGLALSDAIPHTVSADTKLPDFLTNAFETAHPLPAVLIGSSRQIEVWRALTEIAWGKTVSYGQLAQQVFGSKRFARAVGGMVGRNPIAWFIPCHRVLAHDGSLNGFGCGLDVKQDMLTAEGAHSKFMR